MLLDPYNQTDHPDCKSRPDSGLSAITELDPGYITGIFSTHNGWLCTSCGAVSVIGFFVLSRLQALFLRYGKNGLSGALSLASRQTPSLQFRTTGDYHHRSSKSETFTFIS